MKTTVAGLALALAGVGLLLGQEQPTGPIIELPKFVVTDSRELAPPEVWRYATIPGFEILTNASDKATQRLLRDFDMFRQALSHVWQVPNRLSHTTSLIISGKGSKFDAFVPKGRAASAEAGLASLFLKKGSQTAIVIDMQATTLNVLSIDDSLDAATGTDSGQISVEHDKQLYREYVRYLLSQSEPRLGAWLEEGLSQIIMRMKFDRRWIEFAKLEDPNTVSVQAAFIAEANAALAAEDPDAIGFAGAPAGDRDFNAALRRRALMPMEKLFAVAHDSSEATNVLGNNRWAKQCYAFVHMCLYGQKGKFQKAFATFLQRSAREPITEAMFKECFGQTFKQMLMTIRLYCDFTVYEHKYFKSKEDIIIPPPPLALREATQSEIGRIKGEALVLAGHTAKARSELIAPYQRGERDPNLLAALGLYERSAGEDERARKFLEAAFAGKSKRPDACIELARMRQAEAIAKPGAADGRLSVAQVQGILAPLRLARDQPPPMPALYELAGDTWLRSAVRPTPDDAKLLLEGALRFPQRMRFVYQASVAAVETNDVKSAHLLADHGLRHAPDERTKQGFVELKAQLPPAPPELEPAATQPTPVPQPGPSVKRKK